MKERILLVEDEHALAWSLGNRLRRKHPTSAVVIAFDGHAAAERLEEGNIDLLITDVCMPGMDGMELLGVARALHPRLPAIVMTASQAVRWTDTEGPFTRVLAKPFELDELDSVVEEALVSRVPGFSGNVAVQTLPDVLQLYAQCKATGRLSVRRSADEGVIELVGGVVVHAATGALVGEDAFYAMLRWPGGVFSMGARGATGRQTMLRSVQELVLEGARRLDEEGLAPARDDLDRGWSQLPPVADRVDDAFDEVFSVRVPPTSRAPADLLHGALHGEVERLASVTGFVAAAVVDRASGAFLHRAGAGEQLAVTTELLVQVGSGSVEDLAIRTAREYHVLRPVGGGALALYLVVDRRRGDLANAQDALARAVAASAI